MTRYSLPTKIYPIQNEKMSFLCKCTTGYQLKRVFFKLNMVVSHQYHQPTRKTAQFWSTEVFELSYLSTKIIFNKTGCLAINLYQKLTTYAKDLTFSRIYSRLVDVREDMIQFCQRLNRKCFLDICYKLFSLFFFIIFYLFCARS